MIGETSTCRWEKSSGTRSSGTDPGPEYVRLNTILARCPQWPPRAGLRFVRPRSGSRSRPPGRRDCPNASSTTPRVEQPRAQRAARPIRGRDGTTRGRRGVGAHPNHPPHSSYGAPVHRVTPLDRPSLEDIHRSLHSGRASRLTAARRTWRSSGWPASTSRVARSIDLAG
jgi:hypothetical protein